MGVRSFIKDRIRGAGKTAAPPPMREALSRLPAQPDGEGRVAVAPISLVPEGRGNTFDVKGENVAVFRVSGVLYATSDACRHEDGPLGEGDLDGPIVTCPYHDWKYDVTTGDCITEPSRPLPCFDVVEHDGFVWVGRRTRQGSEARGGEHDDGLQTKLVE